MSIKMQTHKQDTGFPINVNPVYLIGLNCYQLYNNS